MKKNILKLGVLLFLMFISITNVDAASYSISASARNVTKGNKIRLTISGSGVTGRFNISTSNSSVASISEDRVWIENNSYTITISTFNTGSATITVSPSGVSDSSGNSANLSSKSITINVSNPRPKSTDNNLRSLRVEGYEISPNFDASIQSYSVTVPEGIKSVNVGASANSSYASVRGTGTISLSEGNNTANVVVTSESGSQKVYTININVKDDNPIKVNVNNKEYTVVKVKDVLPKQKNYKESTVTINETEIPAFINEAANITLVGLKDEQGKIELFIYKDGEYFKYNEIKSNVYTLIPTEFEKELDLIKTKVTINNEEIDAYKYNEKTNYVIISATNLENGKTDLYLYDKENNTAILFDDTLLDKEESPIINDNKLEKYYDYIFIAFAGALLLMLIVIFSLLHSLKKKQKKINKFVQKQEAKLEATRKLNDVVNEVKETIKEEKATTSEKVVDNKKKDKKNKKKEKTVKNKETVEIKEIQTSQDDEVYDLFADDKKKAKKKK